jgi:hypothetical protein
MGRSTLRSQVTQMSQAMSTGQATLKIELESRPSLSWPLEEATMSSLWKDQPRQ